MQMISEGSASRVDQVKGVGKQDKKGKRWSVNYALVFLQARERRVQTCCGESLAKCHPSARAGMEWLR